jgi:hypothetical protein
MAELYHFRYCSARAEGERFELIKWFHPPAVFKTVYRTNGSPSMFTALNPRVTAPPIWTVTRKIQDLNLWAGFPTTV